MKACRFCEEVKPLSDFYAQPTSADGHFGHCKECHKARVKANRALRPEYYKEFDRQRADKPIRVAWRTANIARLRAESPETLRKYSRRSVMKHPAKKAATSALNNAVRDGRITKPDRCRACGSAERIQGHHHDYSAPLDVDWLCSRCHSLVHKTARAMDRWAARV